VRPCYGSDINIMGSAGSTERRLGAKLVQSIWPSGNPQAEAAELGKAIVDRAASTGGDLRAPRSIEITDDRGEELLYVVFWAGPKVGDGPVTPVEPATVH
jgi:hypothetical protein